MKALRGWTLALLMVAACSEAATGPGGKLPADALRAIPPTNNTACNKFWASGVSGNWTDAARWNPAGVPTNTSSVCIDAAGTYTVTLPGGGTTADTTVADILALDVGGSGATPTLVTTNGYARFDVAEGILVRANAIFRLNNSQSGVINAAGTLTNSGSIEAPSPCGGGCAKDHVINANVINTGTILVNGGNLRLPKIDGEYQNTGTVNIASGTMLIPATAGSALFNQDAGVITGASNFNAFTIRSGTFSMNGGKARTRNGASNLKPIVVVEGANLVLGAGASDSATIGVQASSTLSTNITGSIGGLTRLWLAGPADLNPGTITFLDAAPVNNGKIRIGAIDGGNAGLTLGGTGRLTNADSLYDVAISGGFTYRFALEYTNTGTVTVHNTWALEKAGGTYVNSGLITGSGTQQVLGNTFASTATGTVRQLKTRGTPRFQVDGGRLIGVGTSGQITLANGGTVEPGESPGILNARNLDAPLGTSLKIELGGTQVGTEYDQLNLASAPTAQGSLDVSEINGFLSGVCGQVFDVVTFTSTSAGFTYTGLNPAPTRALRAFVSLTTTPDKVILYGYDPTVKISVAPNPVAIAEGGAGIQYAVCLDGALTSGQSVTVTPTPNAQVTVSPPSVTFTNTNWRAPQFFTVTAVDDIAVEGNHTGIVTHAATSNVAAYNGAAIASLTADITDNDAPPQSPTSTSVGSSANPSTFGQSVTFTATVTSGGGIPTGTVQFTIDGSDVGSPVSLDANGQATLAISTLGVGNHPVQATYSGSASFAGSNGALNGGQTVDAAPTSTAVSSSLNPSNVGQSVTFTATVSSGVGTPTGTVQFTIDGLNVGGAVPVVGGEATFMTSALSAGTHPVTATFTGSVSYAGSNGSLDGGQVVNLNATTTGVTSSQNPSTFGQQVIFTATVSSGAGTPSGTVQFSIDGNPVGSAVPLIGGQATHATAILNAGNHGVSATYSGSATHAGSSGALGGVGQTVNAAATTTGVTSSANPSTSGQLVTFTATVTSGAGTPGGSVQFTIDGVDAGSAVALNASGQAMMSTSSLGVGNHTVLASYEGSTNYAASQGSLGGGQEVEAPAPSSTATTMTSSQNPSNVGQSVTFTATVSSTGGTPGGTVQFSIDGTNVGGQVALTGGQAQYQTSSLAAGNHSVVATYSGDATFSGSNGSLAGGQIVNLNATTTSVASSLNPSTFGQSVTFTATVSSGAGAPSGSVQFSIDGNPVGSEPLVGGQATYITSGLTGGTHAVSAAYSANSTHDGSSGSLGGGQQVNPAGTTTTVTSSINPSVTGQNVIFTATVSSTAGTPGGTVQFNIDGSDVGSAVALSGGQATFQTSSLGAGNHAITATYAGSTSFAGSSGTLSGGQQVDAPPPASTTTNVQSSVNPSTFGQSVTFTATVTSGAGTPTGSVQFDIDGSNVGIVALDASGQATFNTSSLAVGSHTVMATYNGSASHASSSGSLTGGQTVNQAGTTTSVASSANPSTVGQSVTFTATVSSAGGTPGGTVQFSIDGSPAGGPVALAGGQASISTSSLAAGNHTVEAAYSGNGSFQGSSGSLSGGQNVNESSGGTDVRQAGIDIQDVLIEAAFKSGADANTARGRFTILNSSSGVDTRVTLGTVTVTFRSIRGKGVRTTHDATCTFQPTDPTGDVLLPMESKVYRFDCTDITPGLLSNASTLTAIVTVVNASNQLGQVRARTWTASSPAFSLP